MHEEALAKLYCKGNYLAPEGRPNHFAGFFVFWPEGRFASGSRGFENDE
jgi:hypothetical protein